MCIKRGDCKGPLLRDNQPCELVEALGKGLGDHWQQGQKGGGLQYEHCCVASLRGATRWWAGRAVATRPQHRVGVDLGPWVRATEMGARSLVGRACEGGNRCAQSNFRSRPEHAVTSGGSLTKQQRWPRARIDGDDPWYRRGAKNRQIGDGGSPAHVGGEADVPRALSYPDPCR